MRPFFVCSFWVHRPADYPEAPNYLEMLKVLDRSCRMFGLQHVVLTDHATERLAEPAGLYCYATHLPRSLMKALTESQARWLAFGAAGPGDTLFVGADCLVRKDPRGHIPAADLAIILRPGHKRHRINNGFMYVPAESRNRVAPLFRVIADSTGPAMCGDMIAVERALAPMPDDYGPQQRAGLAVNFLPMGIWNGGPKRADDPAEGAFVLHFRGHRRKAVMLDWAARWMPV